MRRISPQGGALLGRAAAALFILGTLAGAGMWPAGSTRTGAAGTPATAAVAGVPSQTPWIVVPVGTQVEGTVLKVNVTDRRYVGAGTVLVQLDPTLYRAALAQARVHAAAVAAQARAAQAGLASGRHRAAAGVTAAVGSASTMPPLPSLPPIPAPTVDAATKAQLAQAQRQILAARTQVLNDAQAEAASAAQIVDRDRALLAQGLIAARHLDADTAAYNTAQAQVVAAKNALRSAQSGTRPSSAGSVGQAQAAIAAAQRSVAVAQSEAAAATNALSRNSALAAQGAVAVRRITADTAAQDAAQARLQAATAELRRAQAELTAAQAEAAAAAAARRQAVILARAEAVRAQHAAQTRVLTQQAASTIVNAAQGARVLAALQTEAVTAAAAVRRAEANLAETVVRAPASGWVLQPVVRAGDSVTQDQSVALLAVDARQHGTTAMPGSGASAPGATAAPADALPSSAASSGAIGAGADRAQLAQIAAGERQVLAELNAEATRISSITATGVPEIPPPGTAFSALPYGTGAPFSQAGGSVPTLLNGGMPWPILGAITSGFGWRIHPIFDTPEFHTGVDIAASTGASIDAPASGTVIFAGSLPANGNLVILDHGNGVTTTYSHLSAYRVFVGERVKRGQVIAKIGSTGWSTGPHLFFEIRKNGHPINPLSL